MRFFADRTGLEPATSAVTGQHSNQLNYRSIRLMKGFFRTAKISVSAFFQKRIFEFLFASEALLVAAFRVESTCLFDLSFFFNKSRKLSNSFR
jgi:hypothetical protein